MARPVRIQYEDAFYHVTSSYHLILETPRGNLSQSVHFINFEKRHKQGFGYHIDEKLHMDDERGDRRDVWWSELFGCGQST